MAKMTELNFRFGGGDSTKFNLIHKNILNQITGIQIQILIYKLNEKLRIMILTIYGHRQKKNLNSLHFTRLEIIAHSLEVYQVRGL